MICIPLNRRDAIMLALCAFFMGLVLGGGL